MTSVDTSKLVRGELFRLRLENGESVVGEFLQISGPDPVLWYVGQDDKAHGEWLYEVQEVVTEGVAWP